MMCELAETSNVQSSSTDLRFPTCTSDEWTHVFAGDQKTPTTCRQEARRAEPRHTPSSICSSASSCSSQSSTFTEDTEDDQLSNSYSSGGNSSGDPQMLEDDKIADSCAREVAEKHGYIIRKRLGHGAFSCVYRVRHPDTPRDVALKLVNNNLQGGIPPDEEVELLMKNSNCSQIVKFVGSFVDEAEYTGIVMKLLKGGDLCKFIRKNGKLTDMQARTTIRCTLMALDHIHKEGRVHGDLKPENIVFERADDFGSAKLIDLGFCSPACERSNTIIFGGSIGYSAPEVLRNLSKTEASDIWSIGVIAIAALTGVHPFTSPASDACTDPEKKNQMIVYAIVHSNIRMSLIRNPNISCDALQFIKRCMMNHPKERPSASECLMMPWLDQKRIHRGYSVSLTNPVVECVRLGEQGRSGSDVKTTLLNKNKFIEQRRNKIFKIKEYP